MGDGWNRLARLAVTRFDTDDGFGGLGPVVGRFLRWIPTRVLILIGGLWLLPAAAAFIASV